MTNKLDTMYPESGRMIAENGEVINKADLAIGKVVTFHNEVTATGNGTTVDTNGFKILTLSCKGTNTSRTIEVHGVDNNGVDNILPGFSVLDFTQLSIITSKDVSFQYSIEGMASVYAKITAIGGGNATIKGEMTV